MENISELKKIFVWFLIPVIMSFLFLLCLKDIKVHTFFNLLENILFVLMIIVLSFFIRKSNLRFLFILLFYLLNSFFLLFETLYFYLFNDILTASAIFVMLETNNVEATEFFNSQIDRSIIFYCIGTISLTTFYLVKLVRFLGANSLPDYNSFFLSECLLILYFSLKVSGLIVYNLPYLFIKTPISYFSEMKKFQVYGRENRVGQFTNVSSINVSNEKSLYVVIIGESTSRKHFDLCNQYYRETTPLLNAIKGELHVFNNIISPHTYTIGALSKALTLGNYENPEGKYKGSIIQLFNQANFDTYWVSNQRPVGMMDTHITKIGVGALKSVFLNTKHTNDITVFDEALLKPFDDILKSKGKNKVVFLHLLGTHMDYKNRYPKEWGFFHENPQTKFSNENSYLKINEYDNAIRYNDKVIREVIETVREQNISSYVLFFSDHGQEVYDDIEFLGHTIDKNITKNMYEIPLFVWFSEKYNYQKNIRPNIKYMTDDLFHSIADLSNIKSNETDSSRSIFSNNFKERKRIIKDTIDFDAFF